MNLAALGALKQVVTSKAGLAVLTASKHSPAILFGAGVVGVVGTVILSSRATLKLPQVIEQHENNKEAMKQALVDDEIAYSIKDYKKDLTVSTTHLVLNVGKLYAPSVVLCALSLGALGGSHYILTKRNAQLTAAFVAVDKAFKEYRARVVSDVGEEKDREYMYGVSEKEIMYETKKGEPKTKKVKSFGDGRSPYAVVFDSSNPNWQNTLEYNLYFLRLTQNHLNDRLRARGHVFLNDVYRELGLPDTEAGAVTGWIWGDNGGDQFIDFGIWEDHNLETVREFMRNREGHFLLDFNVDGAIFKKLKG